MSELIRMPSNIYEALLLELAQFIREAWSYDSIDTSSSLDYYGYEDEKESLKNKLSQLGWSVYNLNQYLIGYFESVFNRIKEAPMGLASDVVYGVPMHKVFECLVAAEVNGYVVGGKGDQGIDVIDPDENVIIQCKTGRSYSTNAKAKIIYKKLIQSCIDTNSKRAVLAVTDAKFPSFTNPQLNIKTEEKGLTIELKVWKDYRITHPSSHIYETSFNKVFEQFQDNLKVLSVFLTQIQRSVGQARQIHWDNILEDCIRSIQSLPSRFEDAESCIHSNLNSLETVYENDDTMESWEKAYMRGYNGSNHNSNSDGDSENSDNRSDGDSENSDNRSDGDLENSDNHSDVDSEEDGY